MRPSTSTQPSSFLLAGHALAPGLAGRLLAVPMLAVAMMLAGTGCDPEPSPPAPPSAPKAPEVATESAAAEAQARAEALRELMRDHFGVASQARDSVLRGQLELAQGPLIWLGQHGYSRHLPEALRPHLDRMQQAARLATRESTLLASAQAVAQMAVECGACHVAQKRGPRFEPSGLTDLEDPEAHPAPQTQALRDRMHQHLWGVERMWEGLIGPWDEAFRQGAESLRDWQAHPKLPQAMLPQLQAVRALGEEAAAAADAQARAQAYARVLAACGSCHASAGVDPGASPSGGTATP